MTHYKTRQEFSHEYILIVVILKIPRLECQIVCWSTDHHFLLGEYNNIIIEKKYFYPNGANNEELLTFSHKNRHITLDLDDTLIKKGYTSRRRQP